MSNLFDPRSRDQLRERLSRLDQKAKARWGRLDAHKALCHLIDTFEHSISAQPDDGWWPPGLPLVPVRWMRAIFLTTQVPWPKSFQTSKKLLERQPGSFEEDRQTLLDWLDRFCRESAGRRRLPAHPALGRLEPSEWARFHFRHLDHHLAQFGC